MKPRITIRRTTLLMFGCAAIVLGIGLSYFGWAFSWWWLPSLSILIVTSRKSNIALLLSIIAAGLLLGVWRGGQVFKFVSQYQDLDGEKVAMDVRADTEAIYGKNSQLSFDAADIRLLEPYNSDLPGKISVSGFGEQAIYRGDRVKVEGKLRHGRGSKQAYVSFAELQATGRDSSKLEVIRREFLVGLQNALPEPLASFSAGLLIGQRSTLPENVNTQLAIVGLTHVIAVSGYNLTIIIRAVRRWLKKVSKYQSTAICFGLMLTFLLVTGFSASIVRASIVSTLSLLAWYYGRQFRPLLIILLTAAITGYVNPLYVWSDIGWYLSFLAFFGVLILAPLLQRRLFGQRDLKLIGLVAIESVAAQIMTAPYILWIFHQTSIIAPLSNLLIVPLVPLAMLLSLIAGLAGMLVPAFAGWFGWPARLLLTYMLDMVTLCARIPHALVGRTLGLGYMLTLYASIIAYIAVLQNKIRRKYGIVTETETII